MRLPPLTTDNLLLPDEELGALFLGICIASNAEERGCHPSKIVELLQQYPDDLDTIHNDTLIVTLRMAANGNFAAAGKRLKLLRERDAAIMAAFDMVSSMDEDTKRGVKTRRSARRGHETLYGDPVEKQITNNQRLDLLDEIRRENPTLLKNRVHEIAEALSEERLGKKVNSKTFQRLEQKIITK